MAVSRSSLPGIAARNAIDVLVEPKIPCIFTAKQRIYRLKVFQNGNSQSSFARCLDAAVSALIAAHDLFILIPDQSATGIIRAVDLQSGKSVPPKLFNEVPNTFWNL